MFILINPEYSVHIVEEGKGRYRDTGVIVDGTVKGAYRYQVPCILAGYILLPCGNTISIGVNMKIAFPVQYTLGSGRGVNPDPHYIPSPYGVYL